MNLNRVKVVLFRNKLPLILITILLPIISFFVVRVNVEVNSVYPFFKNLSGYDMSIVVLGDIMEKFLILPILLLCISSIIRKNNFSERIRFKNNSSLCSYYLLQVLLYSVLIAFVYILFTMVFSYILMPKKQLLWTSSDNSLYHFFGSEFKGKSVTTWISPIIIFFVFLVELTLRNLFFSLYFMILNTFFKKDISLIISIVSFIYIYTMDYAQYILGFSFYDFYSFRTFMEKISFIVLINLFLVFFYRRRFISKDYL